MSRGRCLLGSQSVPMGKPAQWMSWSLRAVNRSMPLRYATPERLPALPLWTQARNSCSRTNFRTQERDSKLDLPVRLSSSNRARGPLAKPSSSLLPGRQEPPLLLDTELRILPALASSMRCGPCLVVILVPGCDDGACKDKDKAREPVQVQAFVPELAVERLHVGILCWFAGLQVGVDPRGQQCLYFGLRAGICAGV